MKIARKKLLLIITILTLTTSLSLAYVPNVGADTTQVLNWKEEDCQPWSGVYKETEDAYLISDISTLPFVEGEISNGNFVIDKNGAVSGTIITSNPTVINIFSGDVIIQEIHGDTWVLGTINHKTIEKMNKEYFTHILTKPVVRIGITSTDEVGKPVWPVIEYASKEINQYLQDNGYLFSIEFIIKDCQNQVDISYSNTIEFKESGIDLIIGHHWNSMCEKSYDYINENNMLLLSVGSENNKLAQGNDNLFRLKSPETLWAYVVAKTTLSKEIDNCILIREIDGSWPQEAITNRFIDVFGESGGLKLDKTDIPAGTTDFNDYLNDASDKILNEYEGIVLLASVELANNLFLSLEGYPVLLTVPWFAGSNCYAPAHFPGHEETLAEIGLYNPYCELDPENEIYSDLYDYYLSQTGGHLGYELAAYYDGCWLYALSIIEANDPDAMAVKEVLSIVASGYFGALGDCTLDINGDKALNHYTIGAYVFNEQGNPEYEHLGWYNYQTDEVTWF